MQQIKPHKIPLAFDETLPKHWFGGNAFLTHVLNSWTIIFPDIELYFIRWAKKSLENVQDPVVRKEILGFIGQEMQHAKQHEKLWDLLEKQGYNLKPVLRILNDFCFGVVEKKISDNYNYAAIAGLEHFTAMFAEIGLENPKLIEPMHAEMRRLFEWHAAEEIEHKSVAFDMLMQNDNRYSTRVIAMWGAFAALYALTFGNAFYMMWQDKSIYRLSEWKGVFEAFFTEHQVFPKTMTKFFEYFAQDFHPANKDNYSLAASVFDRYSGEVVA